MEITPEIEKIMITQLQLVTYINAINIKIEAGEIKNVSEIEEKFNALKKLLVSIPKNFFFVSKLPVPNWTGHTLFELTEKQIEKAKILALKAFKNKHWGDFANLNSKYHAELCKILLDSHNNLKKIFEDFPCTVVVMDFHGYTQFSGDIKYNKTPLMEFGNKMPLSIKKIAWLCHSLVYEWGGDQLILIGPPDPGYALQALFSIMEVYRQKKIDNDTDPTRFHGIQINNPHLKPFELTAAATIGGETVINREGRIVGLVISEANRILKVVNEKLPTKSGVMISENVYRRLTKKKDQSALNRQHYLNFENLLFSQPYQIELKGTKINIREIIFDKKDRYKIETLDISAKINNEIKKSGSSKWMNILVYYTELILCGCNYINFTIHTSERDYTTSSVSNKLLNALNEWKRETSPEAARLIISTARILHDNEEEFKDLLAIFVNFIEENYAIILEKMDAFYENELQNEIDNNPNYKNISQGYTKIIEKIKVRYFTKRIFEKVLNDCLSLKLLSDIPYIGKK